MNTGVVHWWNDIRGYGFIIDDHSKEKLFVHYTSIVTDGFKTLEENQKVTYDKYEDEAGRLSAKNVVRQ